MNRNYFNEDTEEILIIYYDGRNGNKLDMVRITQMLIDPKVAT